MMEETPTEMPGQNTLIVLNILQPELPVLLGDAWPAFRDALTHLLDTLDQTNSQDEQERVIYEIHQLLKTQPALLRRFSDVLLTLDPTISEGVIRGSNPLSQLRNWLSRQQHREQVLTRYIDIDCPTTTSLQTPRFFVIVQLKAQPAPESMAKFADTLAVQAEKPLHIRIDAPAFTVLGAAVQTLIFSAQQTESTPLIFALKPAQIGPGAILLEFWQAGQWLGSAGVMVEVITAETQLPVPTQRLETALQTTGHIETSDFILTITRAEATSQKLSFRLKRKSEEVEMEFTRSDLLGSLQDYTRALYQQLKDLLQQVDPIAQATLGIANPLSYRDVDDQLRLIGQNLWRDLIPLELQNLYERERSQWQNRSLLIISDEPDIPWELLSPYGEDWSEEVPLCLLMNMARWLRRGPQVRTFTQPQQQLSLQKLATIVPQGMGLPAAADEFLYLYNFAQQRGFQHMSPTPPTYSKVRAFLRDESYDWVHVATHGTFSATDPSRASAIWLEDRRGLTPDDIVSEIETAIRRQRAAFLLNACEVGQQGWGINGLAGWASRLIGAGAGLFLAPLWPVQDKTAYAFIQSLYSNLAEGRPVAEAVRLARQDIRRLFKNTTWLAYSLYAHPNAKLVHA